MRSNLSVLPLLLVAAVILLLVAIAAGRMLDQAPDGGHQPVPPTVSGELKRYASGSELLKSFAEAATYGRTYGTADGMPASGTWGTVTGANSAPLLKEGSASYSTTNVQVSGVDEADVVKTDGTYIYLVSGNRVVIARAYPAGDAAVIGSISFTKTSPREIVHRRRPHADLRHVLRRHRAAAGRRRSNERVDHALVRFLHDCHRPVRYRGQDKPEEAEVVRGGGRLPDLETDRRLRLLRGEL